MGSWISLVPAILKRMRILPSRLCEYVQKQDAVIMMNKDPPTAADRSLYASVNHGEVAG